MAKLQSVKAGSKLAIRSIFLISQWRKTSAHILQDRENLRDLQNIHSRAGGKAKVMLFGEFAGQKKAEVVQDPYYGARDGFEIAYEQCTRFSNNFLKEVFPDVEA